MATTNSNSNRNTLETTQGPSTPLVVAVRRLTLVERIQKELANPENLIRTLATIQAMAPDPVHGPRLTAWLQEHATRQTGQWELRSALRAIATVIKPERYLELGVRRGWSLMQVLDACPEVEATGVDLWIPNYGDVPNPGANFLYEEINKVVPAAKKLVFLTGTSAEIVPQLGQTFDLIAVDADDTAAGVTRDLENCYPLLRVGGALVCDDLLPGLREVWEAAKRPGFEYLECDGIVPCGIALRVE